MRGLGMGGGKLKMKLMAIESLRLVESGGMK